MKDLTPQCTRPLAGERMFNILYTLHDVNMAITACMASFVAPCCHFAHLQEQHIFLIMNAFVVCDGNTFLSSSSSLKEAAY